MATRSPYTNAPARMPALHASRAADPNVQRSLEALREWVEVRLGSRGDKYEKAVTLRELETLLAPITTQLAALGDFDGDISTLRATQLARLPATAALGSFVTLANGELYFGDGTRWSRITLTPV